LKEQWVECQAIYKAKGNEEYFTLGLFRQNPEFSKLSKKYNKSLLDYKKQAKFLNNTDLYPIYLNNNHHVDLTDKNYGYRANMAMAYYFIDAVSIEPYRSMLNDTFVKSEFKGDIYNYFYSRLQFPGSLATKGIQGDLVVSFLINEKGDLDSIRVLQTPDSQITSEVISVLNQTDGMWSPTIENGKATSFMYKLVFRYQIIAGNRINENIKIKEEALSNFHLSKYKTALKKVNKALSLNPYDSELYLIRSNIYKALQQYENAMVDYNTATQMQDEIMAVLGLILGT